MDDIVKIYKEVLNGTRKRFPNGFWDKSTEGYYNAKVCTTYLLEVIMDCKTKGLTEEVKDVLLLKKNNIIEVANIDLFKKYKLKGMITLLFDNSHIKAIQKAYGYEFILPWEFKMSPLNFWKDKGNVKDLVKWIIKKEKITDENIYSQYKYDLFVKYGVTTALEEFQHSPFLALDYTYPNKYKIWLFEQSSVLVWDDIKNIKETVEFILKENGITDDNIYEKYNNHLLIKTGYKSLLKKFNNNSYEILNMIFPNKYDKGEFVWNQIWE